MRVLPGTFNTQMSQFTVFFAFAQAQVLSPKSDDEERSIEKNQVL